MVNDAVVLHFLGKSKPWIDNKVLFGELFDKYVSETPWSEHYIKIKKANIRKNRLNRILIPKGSRRREIFLKIKYKNLLNKKQKGIN